MYKFWWLLENLSPDERCGYWNIFQSRSHLQILSVGYYLSTRCSTKSCYRKILYHDDPDGGLGYVADNSRKYLRSSFDRLRLVVSRSVHNDLKFQTYKFPEIAEAFDFRFSVVREQASYLNYVPLTCRGDMLCSRPSWYRWPLISCHLNRNLNAKVLWLWQLIKCIKSLPKCAWKPASNLKYHMSFEQKSCFFHKKRVPTWYPYQAHSFWLDVMSSFSRPSIFIIPKSWTPPRRLKL